MTSPTTKGNLTKKNNSASWPKRILKGLSILLIGLIICGFLFQTIAVRHDQKKYPPPGELIDAGGYELHLYCQGEGSPTVILEAGLGDNWLVWHQVQPQIAELTRVCAYDRAGLGWSDSPRKPLEKEQIAETLHTLLHNASIQGPYVLVGHSAGGLHVRSFANQYPQEVAGMVLVDSFHENQFFELPTTLVEANLAGYSQTAQMLKIVHLLAPFGVIRGFGLGASFAHDDIAYDTLSPQDQQTLIAIYNRTHFSRALRYEFEQMTLTINQPSQLQNLGDLPLTVLAKPGDTTDSLPQGITAETILESNEIMLELQAELAALSTNGKLIIVEDTGHYIHLDQPETVVTAITDMVESLQ